MMPSAILIVDKLKLEQANAFCEFMGWGSDCFSVPLKNKDTGVITHYGCRSDVSDSFITSVENPEENISELIDGIIYKFTSEYNYTDWENILLDNNLEVLTGETDAT